MTVHPGPVRSGIDLGGVVQRAVLVLAALVLACSALAALLGAIGWWRPALALPVLLLATIGLIAVVRPVRTIPMGTAPTLALLAVCTGSGWWAAATHSTQVLPRRDAGSNFQAAVSLAETGSRIITLSAAAVGGSEVLSIPGVGMGSPAFYAVGSAQEPAVQPQFVIGPAAIFSLGRWLGGSGTMLIQPAWLGAVGLLALGLVAALTIGRWWGAVAAGAIAIAFPMLHAARATYSEPLALVTLGAGLLAWVLAAQYEDRRAALLAGLLIGGTCLVRIDGLREAILLLPVAVLGSLHRHRWVRPLIIGTAISTGFAMLAALALSNRYLGDIAASLLPLVALGVVFVVAGALAVRLGRRGATLPSGLTRRLPEFLAGAVVLVGLLLAARPLFMTVRQDPRNKGAPVVAGMQLREGVPVDGSRTYAEQSVTWLSWWLGPVSLIVALLALAVLVRRLASWETHGDRLPSWTGPLAVATGSTLLTLLRPGITPDHPWAERRLTIAVPLVVILVVATAARLWRGAPPGGDELTGATDGSRTPPDRSLDDPFARDRPHLLTRAGYLHRRGPGRLLALLVLAALLVPTAAATWPHRAERVEAGSLGPVAAVCRSLQPGDVVLPVDARAANEWPQVIRGMCGGTALGTSFGLRSHDDQLLSAVPKIQAALPPGSRLVLVAGEEPEVIEMLGGTPQLVADSTVQEDERLLEHRPDGLTPLPIRIWIAPLD